LIHNFVFNIKNAPAKVHSINFENTVVYLFFR